MDKQIKALIWLPVILCPARNLLTLLFAPGAFEPHILLYLIGAIAEELFFR